MPVLRPICLAMDCLKSAEFIQELKSETEKIVSRQNSSQKPNSPPDMVCLESEFPYESKPNHLTTLRRNVIPYPDHNYGQQPPLTPPGLNSPDPNEQTDTGNEDEDEEGVTRCICGFSHDDGYMICCDRCGSWQHIECMGIKSDSVPETYFCDRCEPRTLNVERARAIQSRKKDRQSDDDGDDDTDTDEESASTSYTAISNTPTRITLTARPTMKNKGKSRLKNTNLDNQGKRRKSVNRKRQRKFSRHGSEAILPNESNSMEIFICHDSFQLVENCIYDEAVTTLKLQNTENVLNNFGCDGKNFCVADVQENRKGLIATEDIKQGTYITEYMGKVSLLSTFEERSPFFKRALPFVLYYNKIDQLELVIDARVIGNEARYIQRSCVPNSVTQHVVKDGNIHVMITCKKDIAKGAHITIPFEYPLETYLGFINCACNQITCLALHHNQRFLPQSGRKRTRYSNAESSTRNSASENQGDTDSDDNEVDVGSGERPMSRRKTLSREERKLQAYVKQIEKMEKKEKKVKDPKAVVHRPMQLVDSVNTQSVCPNRVLQVNGISLPQSPMAPQTRRISTGTPGSARKRLSVSKKRPRISSCSSDPLSPDLSSLVMATASSNTPVQESIIYPFSVDQNGHLRQKTRRDKEQFSLSMSLDRSPALKEATRKLRKDYIEAKAGSPTPPSTPGQLSPASRAYGDHSLSVDVTNCMTSPSSNFLSIPDRRNVLNGLLQIAEQADNDSTCSGSPISAMATSNGMATAEEVMGDVIARDGGVHTPAARVLHKRLSKDCGYFGSLKKRWLVQYDRGTSFKTRRVNGCTPVSLSSLINDYSIRRRADQIVSYSFHAPQSCIPLKKRMLRAALSGRHDTLLNGGANMSETVPLTDSNKAVKSSPKNDHLVRKTDELTEASNDSTALSSMDIKKTAKDCDEILDGKKDVIGAEKYVRLDVANKDIEQHVVKNLVQEDVNDTKNSQVENNKEQQACELEEVCIDKPGDSNIKESSDIKPDSRMEIKAMPNDKVTGLDENLQHEVRVNNDAKIGSKFSNDGFSSTPKHNADSHDKLKNCDTPVEGNSDITETVVDNKAENFFEKIAADRKTEISDNFELSVNSSAKLDVLDTKLLANIATSEIVEATRNTLHNTIVAQNETTAIQNSELDTSSDASTVAEIKGTKVEVAKTDVTVSSVDENSTKTDSLVAGIAGIEARRLSAMVRDPRLSSSSSRSSRDSFDNVFVRSDSVSSIDDNTGQRLDSEKRSMSGSIEKLDSTPGGKKKMSLREYRNRKRTKPSASTAPHSSTTNADNSTSKPQQEAPAVLLTDTDALLTPRTLTLSTGLAGQHAREAVSSVMPPSVSLTMPSAQPGVPLSPSAMSVGSSLMLYPSSTMPLAASGIPPISSMMLLGSSVTPDARSVIAPAHSSVLSQVSTLQGPPVVMHQCEHVTSNGPMFEPVSPGDDYMAEPMMVEQSKLIPILSSQPYVNYTNIMTGVRRSLPGSPCDAMDIEDDESSPANKILVGLPNMDARKPYMQKSTQHYDRQATKSLYHVQQMRGPPQGTKNIDNRSINHKPTHGYSQQFRG